MTRSYLPADFRGWLALGLFVQSNFLFVLMWAARDLLNSQGFMTLASAVIVTAWVGGAVSFAYQMGKNVGEQTAAVNKALDLAAANAPTPPAPDIILKPGETAKAEESE